MASRSPHFSQNESAKVSSQPDLLDGLHLNERLAQLWQTPEILHTVFAHLVDWEALEVRVRESYLLDHVSLSRRWRLTRASRAALLA